MEDSREIAVVYAMVGNFANAGNAPPDLPNDLLDALCAEQSAASIHLMRGILTAQFFFTSYSSYTKWLQTSETEMLLQLFRSRVQNVQIGFFFQHVPLAQLAKAVTT